MPSAPQKMRPLAGKTRNARTSASALGTYVGPRNANASHQRLATLTLQTTSAVAPLRAVVCLQNGERCQFAERRTAGIPKQLDESLAHAPLELFAEVGPPEFPRLRGREPWLCKRLDDFVREVPLIARKARRSVPVELRSDALVDTSGLRAVQLIRAPMQVPYLFEQGLKWLVIHTRPCEATAGGPRVGGTSKKVRPPQ